MAKALDIDSAMALLGKLTVIPHCPTRADALGEVAEWLCELCLRPAVEAAIEAQRMTPYEYVHNLVRRVAWTSEDWGGIPMLERIHEQVLKSLAEPEWKPQYTAADYEPPACAQCGDMGYWRPPGQALYERCACGAMPGVAEKFLAIENERIRRPSLKPRPHAKVLEHLRNTVHEPPRPEVRKRRAAKETPQPPQAKADGGDAA